MPSVGIQRLRTLTRVLDELVPIPGTGLRIGLDPVLGLMPGAGDAAGAVLSAYALVVAVRLGAPAPVLLRMTGNIAVDAVFGGVPFLGDLFDFGWRANRRNLALLERYERAPVAVSRGSRALLAALLLALAVLLGCTVLGSLYLVQRIASLAAGY
jgi:hypothetical protein